MSVRVFRLCFSMRKPAHSCLILKRFSSNLFTGSGVTSSLLKVDFHFPVSLLELSQFDKGYKMKFKSLVLGVLVLTSQVAFAEVCSRENVTELLRSVAGITMSAVEIDDIVISNLEYETTGLPISEAGRVLVEVWHAEVRIQTAQGTYFQSFEAVYQVSPADVEEKHCQFYSVTETWTE